MTNDQFQLLVKLMRGNNESPATKAAQLVLVKGAKQAEAARATGASLANVHDAFLRYSLAHQQILQAYGLGIGSDNCKYFPRGVSSDGEERLPATSTQRAKVMDVELQVDSHPSGNRTLKERNAGERVWRDCRTPSGLFVNPDPQDFYARVQQYIDGLLANNVAVKFTDTSSRSASSMGIVIRSDLPMLSLQNLDFDKLANHPEPTVVDTISQLLQANYPSVHTSLVSWLAYREQIQIAHARHVYANSTEAGIALRWGRLARDGKLKVSFDETYGLDIRE